MQTCIGPKETGLGTPNKELTQCTDYKIGRQHCCLELGFVREDTGAACLRVPESHKCHR